VYWVILAWPACPSFFSVSSRGITTVSSCRMMLDVMYGIMPSANTDSCSSAPPENRLSRVKTPLVSVWVARKMHCLTFLYDTPGLGSVAPSR
jgi:hypothetical protein